MPDSQIFCNSPWYELHIYWDGTLAFCCHATPRVPYADESRPIYNIRSMSIREWYDSPPMRQARLRMWADQRWDHCDRCWHEEATGETSRRHRSNQKSVIFRQAFDASIQQSPGWSKFSYSADNQGAYDGMPVDLHVDLGNYCNLACKMCNPSASSRIASQYRQWGLINLAAQDWTAHEPTWQRFKQELLDIPQLKNIHFMGGETVIQPRFHDLVDHLMAHGKTDCCLSFVTNGTTYDPALMAKLRHFARVGLEISIEALDQVNDYVRQGTDTQVVLANIERYLAESDGSKITVTLRPAPGLLTVKSYWQLIEFALAKGLLIKSNLCTSPKFLDMTILPADIKMQYLACYRDLLDRWNLADKTLIDINESDPNNWRSVAKNQIVQIINLLNSPRPTSSDTLLADMVAHVKRWDAVYQFDARKIYPEFKEILDRHGY